MTVTATRDGDKMVAWLREAAIEIEKAHAILDQLGIPRSIADDGVECTLAARIVVLTQGFIDVRDHIVASQGEDA